VLGSILIDRDAIVRVMSFLRPEDFYRGTHSQIYAACLDLFERREPVDFVTLTEELQRRGRLEQVGGQAYLASLSNIVPTSVNVEYYGRIVARAATLRRLIDAAGQIAALAYSHEGDAEEAIDKAEQVLFGLLQRRSERGFIPLKEVLEKYFDQIEYLYQHHEQGYTIGVPTGFRELDALTGGLQRSDLIILAARPSVGKSSLALNIAQNAALLHQIPVAIFSLEMSREQLVQRLISAEAEVDSHRLRTGQIEEPEWTKIARAVGVLAEAPIFVDDTPNISGLELRAKARRLQAEQEIGLVVLDYLQLMQGRRAENRVQEISEISRSLKALARELNVPVLALSQLSRAVENRPSHVPVLSDLRESGSIEQDADVVLFIYREEMYNPNTPEKGLAKVIIAKHRNGPTGEITLRFINRQTRFVDLAVREHAPR